MFVGAGEDRVLGDDVGELARAADEAAERMKLADAAPKSQMDRRHVREDDLAQRRVQDLVEPAQLGRGGRLDLAADLKAFASSPQGQALASVTEKPVETGPERDASTQALMRDLKQFASTRQPDASTPSQEPELQLKR